MNAFDHVFGKVLGKMQLTVKLEGGVLGKMGSSKTDVSRVVLAHLEGNFFNPKFPAILP